MTDWLRSVFSTDGFVPRKDCGAWTPEWIALHTTADVLIWMAYLSIPLVLLAVARHPATRPLRPLLWLFAAFIVSCGFSHLLEAVIFEHPLYRLSGVVKGLTAAVSWATVFALVPSLRKVLPLLDTVQAAGPPPPAEPDPEADRPPSLVYTMALLMGLLAVLVRYALDPMLGSLPAHGISILAIIFVAWYGGFGPGLVTLLIGVAFSCYLFLPPRYSFWVEGLNHQVDLGVYLMTGLGVLVLGELQRRTRRRLHAKITQLAAATAALNAEQQATERALAQLDALVRNAPYSIAFLDHELRPVRVNDTFARTSRMAVEDHYGRRLPELFPDIPSDLVDQYHEVLAGGPPVVGRQVAGDGRVWEVSAFRVPLDDDHGGLGVIGQDVTEREATAERLRESEGRFRLMAESMPQIVWMTRPDGYHEYYNARWYEYTGLTPEQSIGRGWSGPLHPDDVERSKARWQLATDSGEPYQIEYRFRRHDGEYEWFLGRALPVRDESGNIVRWLGTCTGIDEQVKTAQALAESESRFRHLADAMPQIVYVSSAAGGVEYVNRQWVEYTGQPNAQTADLTPLVHPDDLPVMVRRWDEARAAGTPFESEFRLRGAADGEYRWFLTRSVPARGSDGAVDKWYGTSTDIHDQKRAEEQLRDARRFTESVLHSLPGHLAVIEADGRILSVNESWRQFGVANGVPADHDWAGQNYFDACRRDEYGERAAAGIRAVASGERGAFELEYPCHGGGVERYFLLRANRFRGEGPVRLVVTHENITERVVAERKVREAADQLAQLTEGVPLLMWACKPSGECDYLSRQWLEYTGHGLAAQLGYGWLDAVHPDDREPTAAAWRAAVGRGGEYDVAFRIRRHDGAYRWFDVRGFPLRDHAGRVVRWYGSCTDVDDRVRQEDILERLVEERTTELRRQQIFLNAILDNVAEGIVACDADGKLQLFNAATRRIHGLPAEPLPADRWADHYQLFEADGLTPMPTTRIPLHRAWRGEEVKDAEMVVRATGQPERYVVCFGQQLRGDDGAFGAVVSMRDMTERREYERELVRTADALRASNEELEKFAYIASHDLQEPLRKIQAFGTRLADRFREAVGEQGKDYIDRMLDSAGRMRRLIEDLLAFSRVTTKGLSFVPVNLDAVARDVLSDLEEGIARSGGRVEVGGLPTVPGDPSQLRQVFQNLIGNALKFAKPDVPPVVRVSAVPFDLLPPDAPPPPPGPGWRITVADNGIGFDPQYAGRIFELFQRLHGRGEYEGTGLGLAIVRKIVLRHGAAITAHARPGVGAEFTLDWPARPTPDPPPPRGD